MSKDQNKIQEYKVLNGFVKNIKGEEAKPGTKIKLTNKFVISHNLINRGKIEIYMTKKEKEDAAKEAKELAELESEE